MNAIRRKLLISSLKVNYKFKKNIIGVLEKFVEDENKIQSIKKSLSNGNEVDLLKNLIETGFFYHDELKEFIIEVWEKLSLEQHQEILLTLFDEKNIHKTRKAIFKEGRYFFYKLFLSPMGDLLYNLEFLNKLPYINNSSFSFRLISSDQDFDLDRIIADDDLLHYYVNKTSVFIELYYRGNKTFTSEQANKLLEHGVLWVIKFSDKKDDVNYIENIIMNYADKIDYSFIDCLTDDMKNNPRIQLSALLSGNKKLNLIVNEHFVKDNLYMLKYIEKHTKLTNKNYDIDNKLYALVTMNDYFVNGIVRWNDGVHIGFIEDKLSDNEIKTWRLIHDSDREDLDYSVANPNSFNDFYKLMIFNNKILNLGITNSQILSVLNKNSNMIKTLIEQNELNRTAATNLYYAICNDTLDVFLDFCNLGTATKVNMSIITKDLIDRIGYDIIRNTSLFPECMYYVLDFDKKGKLESYKKLLNVVDKLPLDKVRTGNILIYTYVSFENLIERMIKNNELTAENVIALINMTQSFSLVNADKCDSIKEYYEKTSKFCDDNINTTVNALVGRELLCQRFFGSGYNQMMDFYESFSCSIDKIKDVNIQKMFELLDLIKDNNNLEEIKQLYNQLQCSNFKLNSLNFFHLIEQLKKEVIGDYLVHDTINNQDKLDVVDYTGKTFNCLIHVVGGYGSIVSAGSLYDSWNSNVRIDNSGICTSLINENYLGHAKMKKDSVIFGFDNVLSSEVQLMGPYDLYSSAYGFDTVTTNGRSNKFYDAKDLISNTRAHHNEVLINRNLSGGNKRQPSYILCFDKINNESKNASKQFGIPIIFIDVKRHLQIKINEIERLKHIFASNPNIDVMKTIINMQETLRCGFFANHEHLAKTYFNKEIITNNILFIINNCNDIEILEQLELLLSKEINRFVDETDHRNISFNGDVDLITTNLQAKKHDLMQKKALSDFNDAREEQRISDAKERSVIFSETTKMGGYNHR